MKAINQFLFPAVVLVLFTFLISCNTEKVGFYNHNDHHYAIKENPLEYNSSEQKIDCPEPIEAAVPSSSDLSLETPKEIVVVPKQTPRINPLPKSEILLPEVAKETVVPEPIKKLSKEQKKEIRRILKQEQGARTSVIGKALLIIFSIVLPPLAVALVDGFSGPFWLDLLLTILFYLPGIIYALYRVLRTR
jgi:uncharacterized membrane protein YqaE (UPF0057 family)